MSYRIDLTHSLEKERTRIALAQIDKAIRELDNGLLDTREYIHQVRVRMKKLRALLRLYRFADEDWYQRENQWFRELAQEYAGPRDADVAVDTCNNIIKYFEEQVLDLEYDSILKQLDTARSIEFKTGVSTSDLRRLRKLLCESKVRIKNWPVKKLKLNVIINGFGVTYSRGRSALKCCTRDTRPEAWHEWRKRVKYQRYQWKLLQGVWPKLVNSRRHELHRLSNLLGEDHDLYEFIARIERMGIKETGSKEKIIALAKIRSNNVRSAALSLGHKLFADSNKCTKAHLKTLLLIACEK